MNARRTPWWHPVLALLVGVLAGVGIAMLGEHYDASLIGAPWFVGALLIIVGIVVLVLALNVHKYATTDPKKRPNTFVNPTLAFNTLVLCKALILAGAALAGWYGGQIIPSVAHVEASFYEHAVVECAITAAVCLIDMVIGLVGERLCQLPPTEGPEHPKTKAAARKREVAPAAAKTMPVDR